MPNYIKNRVTAVPRVLASLKNDDGEVALEALIPFPEGLFMGNLEGGIDSLSEDCAEKAFNEPPSSNPLIAALAADNAKRWSASDLQDDSFEDFIGMCRSKRATGFYHVIDFCKNAWGTKWGAIRSSQVADCLEFETAWSTPEPVWIKLSETHPTARIIVAYADENLGHNCGTITLMNGAVQSRHDGDLGFAHDVWGHSEEYRAELAAEWAADEDA